MADSELHAIASDQRDATSASQVGVPVDLQGAESAGSLSTDLTQDKQTEEDASIDLANTSVAGDSDSHLGTQDNAQKDHEPSVEHQDSLSAEPETATQSTNPHSTTNAADDQASNGTSQVPGASITDDSQASHIASNSPPVETNAEHAPSAEETLPNGSEPSSVHPSGTEDVARESHSVPADTAENTDRDQVSSPMLSGEVNVANTEAHSPSTGDVHTQASNDPDPVSKAEEPVDPTQIEMALPYVKYAQNTIRSLKSRREAAAFLQPVDPIALKIPHYTQMIRNPMDLGTIDQKLALTAFQLKGGPNAPQNRMSDKLKQAVDAGRVKLDQDSYKTLADYERDVYLVFDNCRQFNGPDHIFTKNAEVLRTVFEKQRPGLLHAVEAANEQSASEARRRSSNSLPTIRRSINGSRPKREIHPPTNRDLPWSEEHLHPASKRAILNRHGKNGHMSQREQAYWSKVVNDELKFCVRVVDELLKPANRDVAWVFYDLPAKDFDWAPAYYATIKKPVALTPIQKKLKTGGYADLAAFDADMQLLFQNCFTFNPPDSDVYAMGQKLKDVYESKMQKKPVPPPFEPEEEMDVDDDDDDDDIDPDDANAVLVQQLQRQIAELEGTLETLENSKSKNPVLITSTRVALNSVQAALAGAMSVSSMMNKKGKKRSQSDGLGSAKKKNKGEIKKTTPSKTKKSNHSPAPRKRSAGSDDEDVRTVTFDQKEELAAKITELTDERLEGAIRILNEDKPPGQQGAEDDEIELDIDELSPQTLFKLYKYVVRPKKKVAGAEVGANGKPVPASQPIDGRKRGTGGLKKKNLDETEEAERIARLQQQLEQFNDPDHMPKPSTPGAEPDASSKHDDLVPSDISSGEDDSDSESDMD
ncbi:hypothetical protein MPSI1_000067 [Malassezia psittaci]|uniref:Uncharacterized protein n=1 Tax=Malassezia psittaci TaxID=1821823 RepID=A0AAF0F257_9BASI|nr:hypothetical protein MPSI1_000067 [Malassezia psittaci]